MTAVAARARMSTPPETPGWAVTGLAVRQVRRGAALVTGLSAGVSALVAATYTSTVGTGVDVASLAALAANPAVRTMFGEPAALDDPGGFTVWRTGTVVAVLLGVWGLLAVTRITRGEEDAGRWDLLLAGRVPVDRVVGRALLVVTSVMALAGTAIALAMVVTGAGPSGAVLHGAGLALLGMFFVGVGGLTAQVFPARGPANGAAMAVLGATLLLRMVGDGVAGLGWARWLTPFGLVELSRPYDGNRWLPLLLLAVAAASGLLAAPAVAARRDLRGGRLAVATARAPRLALLGSVAAFAVRRTLHPLVGWSAGIGAYFLLIGLIADSLTAFLTDNPRFAQLAEQAGFASLSGVQGYAATLFALLAVPVGVFTAVRIAAFAADETDRRLTLLYAGPVTRTRSAGAEAAAAAAGAVVLAVVAGVATWLGTTIAGAGLRLGAALAGVVNVLPIVALCLGAAVLALGVLPRAVSVVGALPAAGGFLLLVVADSVAAPGWVRGLSPFAHLAPVPQAATNWVAAAVMLVVALALALVGLVAYERRDLRG
jgi:ABC-2 type transport system permease protein